MKQDSLESPWAGGAYGVFGTYYVLFLCVCLLINLLSVKGGRQLARVGSFLLSRGLWVLNSGHQASRQGSLLTEPSHWFHML